MTARLDPRLKAVADAVRPGARVADVGCDHGYLICALVESGICSRGWACDIRTGPLEAARRNISKRGLGDRIETVLCDGLTKLPGDQIDDVVIAGIGGELIGEILTAASWTRDPQKRFVFQPMTRSAYLRRFLYREGYALLAETAVESGHFIYTVMTAAWSGERREISELFAETGLLLGQGNVSACKYLEAVRARLEKQAAGLERAAKNADTEHLRTVINAIQTEKED